MSDTKYTHTVLTVKNLQEALNIPGDVTQLWVEHGCQPQELHVIAADVNGLSEEYSYIEITDYRK